MSAFIIVDIKVKDPDRYADYVKRTPATLETYGGRFVVRGGAAENLEGDWEPNPHPAWGVHSGQRSVGQPS